MESNHHPFEPKPTVQSNQVPSRKYTSSRITIESELYRKISTELTELAMELGYDVPISKFFSKTIRENWQTEMARYKRIDSALHRNKP